MTGRVSTDTNISRSRWAVALSAIPREQILALAERLAEHHRVVPVTLTQAGLALMPLRETVEGDTFYLGEVPLSRSHVELHADSGKGTIVQGGAVVLADDSDLADALAICDGVLAGRLQGWEEVDALIQEGSAILARRTTIRKSMLTRSRVHFALLNQDDDLVPSASENVAS